MAILRAVIKEKDHDFKTPFCFEENILETTFCHPSPPSQKLIKSLLVLNTQLEWSLDYTIDS